MILIKDQHFAYYRGFIYANRPTNIHARISNKEKIESALNQTGFCSTLAGLCAETAMAQAFRDALPNRYESLIK